MSETAKITKHELSIVVQAVQANVLVPGLRYMLDMDEEMGYTMETEERQVLERAVSVLESLEHKEFPR